MSCVLLPRTIIFVLYTAFISSCFFAIDTHENAETAANPDDELDIEERLLKGLSAKAAREKKRRFYDEFSDDEEEDEDEDGEDVDEGAEGFEGSYEGANEGDDGMYA